MTNQSSTSANPEQVVYAGILEKGMLIGLVLMFITFGLYIFGVVKPVVPRDSVANYWSLPVTTHAATDDHAAVKGYLETINDEYLHLAAPPIGWSWLKLINKGDFLNFVPIAMLAGVTILCYGAIVPVLLKGGDTAYALMAVLEVLILTLAASGLLAVGGH